MSSYRGQDTFRLQTRSKGRIPFKHGADPMQSGRGRFVQGMQLPIQQSGQYPGYHASTRSNHYSNINSSEYVTYPQQVSVQAPNWNPSIPITVSDSYQHSYQPQPPVYNPDSPHMMAVQTGGYMPPVQSQTEFDPVTNVCICSKCGFVNRLALVQLKNANEELKVLREQLTEKERQLEEMQQMNASYEDEDTTQNTVHQSSLSVDAQPFQMAGAAIHDTYQESHVTAESASNNPNGETWTYADTPVVSASVATSDQYDTEPAADNNWDDSAQFSLPQASSEQTLPSEVVQAPATEDTWDQDDRVMSASGPFEVATHEDDDTNHQEPEQSPISPNDDGCISPKEVKSNYDPPKSRPRDMPLKNNTRGGRGNRNDRQDNESRGTYNRRGSGGSNTGHNYRQSSPHDQTDRQFSRGATDSRDSSHSRAKSRSEAVDKVETSSVEEGEKRFDSAERNSSDRRLDGVNRRHSQDKHFFDSPGDRGHGRRGAGGRKYEDRRSRASNESNWRSQQDGERLDRDDNTRTRNDSYPRSGGRSSDSYKKPPANYTFKAVSETDGDLFKAPSDFSLAHCVAEDLRMGSGIAVAFRQQFKCVDELLDQNKRVGEVAVLEDKSRFIFYLITKCYSSDKPMWYDFSASIMELKNLCKKHNVKNLAMPRLGCGLDRLDWRDVKKLVEDTFVDSGVSVMVYNFQQNEDENAKQKSSFFIVHEKKDLVDINPETGLIFLCSESSNTDRTLESLDKKHKIMYDYRSTKKVVGEMITIQKGKEYLYGLVVKKSEKDPLSYVNLCKCLRKFRNMNSKEKYGYFGLEAFRDKDPLTMEKVVTVFRSLFAGISYKMELYICWPEELRGDHRWDEPSTPTSGSK